MAQYDPVGGKFGVAHERFTLEDKTFDYGSLAEAYDADTRARGRRAFALRALDEQRSLLAFSELLTELCELGAPIDVLGSLTRVVRDEARHVDLCGRVTAALGGVPDGLGAPRWVRSDKRQPLRTRVLRTIVGSLCLGETISVAMINGVRERTTDAIARGVLTQMVADESFHSRFGWWWLEQFASSITDDEHRQLASWLPRAIASAAMQMRPTPKPGAKPRETDPFGTMPASDRVAAFDRVMETTVIPGFRRAGLELRAGAW